MKDSLKPTARASRGTPLTDEEWNASVNEVFDFMVELDHPFGRGPRCRVAWLNIPNAGVDAFPFTKWDLATLLSKLRRNSPLDERECRFLLQEIGPQKGGRPLKNALSMEIRNQKLALSVVFASEALALSIYRRDGEAGRDVPQQSACDAVSTAWEWLHAEGRAPRAVGYERVKACIGRH